MRSRMDVETELRGIGERRRLYSEFARGRSASPFEHLSSDVKRAITVSLDKVKSKSTLTEKLLAIHTLASTLPEDEAAKQEVLRQVQSAIEPRLAELIDLIDQVEIIGAVPAGSGFSTEEELRTEYEILAYIYAGNTPIDRAEIRRFAAEAAGVRAAEAGTAAIERRLGPENLPNDFFVFLSNNKVPLEELLEVVPDTDPDKEKKVREKYLRIGNQFLSIALGKMQNDFSDNFAYPNFGAYTLGSFPGAKNPTSYTVTKLMEQSDYGVTALSQLEQSEAEKMRLRLTDFLNFSGGIHSTGETFKKKIGDSPEKLAADANEYAALPPTDYDIPGFWYPLVSSTGTSSLEEIHFMYQDEEGNWQKSELSFYEQFLQSYLEIKETSRFPGQTTNQLPVLNPQNGYSDHIRNGTHNYLGRSQKRSIYQPRIVKQYAVRDTSIFPYNSEQVGGVKAAKRATITKIVEKVGRKVSGRTEKEKEKRVQSAKLAVYNAANMMMAWWVSPSMEGKIQEKEVKAAFGIHEDAVLTDDFWRKLTTQRTESVILGPAGLNFPGYDNEPLTNLTALEVLIIKGKLDPYSLGGSAPDRAFKLDGYAHKCVTETGKFGPFNERVLGRVRTQLFTFEDYFVDWETGESLGQVLEALAVTVRDLPRATGAAKDRLLAEKKRRSAQIEALMANTPTQAYAGHHKDSLGLTKTILDKTLTISGIAKLNIEKNVLSDVSEKVVNGLISLHRTVANYQLGRDCLVPTKVQKGFFETPDKYNNLGDHCLVIRIKDRKTGKVGQRLIRTHQLYHLTPTDFLNVIDSEALENGGSAEYGAPIKGVKVFDIEVADISKAYSYKRHEENNKNKSEDTWLKQYSEGIMDEFGLARPEAKTTDSGDPWMTGYIDVLQQRHIMKTFFYLTTEGDEMLHMTYERRLIFGLVFSAEMREKFKRGEYTRGYVSQTLINFANSIPFFFSPEYFEVEMPAIAGHDLFSEKVYTRMMIDNGYVRTSEELFEQLEKAGSVFVGK